MYKINTEIKKNQQQQQLQTTTKQLFIYRIKKENEKCVLN